jgi:hypothetical protein
MGVEVPCALAPVDVAGVDKAISLDVGGNRGCAVEDAGTVACWGSNIPGVKHTDVCTSGRANEPCSRTAVKIAAISDAVEVAVAELAICVRTKSGRILCWGSHNSGELGDGKPTKHESDTPVEVVGIRDAVQLAASSFGFCARHASGEVSCWGNNDYGELGDGTVGGETGKNKVLGRGKPGRVLVAAGKPLTGAQTLQVESGLRCASREDGLYCWGSIPRKMLPEGLSDPCPDAADGSCKRTAIKVADTSVQHYVSGGQSCILLASGKVVCRERGTVPAAR